MTANGSDRLARRALDAHPVGTLVVDLMADVMYSNAAARDAFGLAGPSGDDAVQDWQPRDSSLDKLLAIASVSSNWIPSVVFRNGVELNIRLRGFYCHENKAPRILITTVPDATQPFMEHARQIKRLNEQMAMYRDTAEKLRRSVAASEALKRELVHRVKNNLAIISALLRNQARAANNPLVTNALQDASSRIMSISTVHEVLDRNGDSKVVDLTDLFTRLIGGLRDAICPGHIRIETHVDGDVLDIDLALPLALLVNELVTNAIKHAFRGRSSGWIRVDCSHVGDDLEVRVADNGIGIPRNASGSAIEPKVVAALAGQIGATLHCRVDGGTEWTLRFPTGKAESFGRSDEQPVIWTLG